LNATLISDYYLYLLHTIFVACGDELRPTLTTVPFSQPIDINLIINDNAVQG